MLFSGVLSPFLLHSFSVVSVLGCAIFISFMSALSVSFGSSLMRSNPRMSRCAWSGPFPSSVQRRRSSFRRLLRPGHRKPISGRVGLSFLPGDKTTARPFIDCHSRYGGSLRFSYARADPSLRNSASQERAWLDYRTHICSSECVGLPSLDPK